MDPFEYQSLKDARMTFEEATNLIACIDRNSTLKDLTIQEHYNLSLWRSFIDTRAVQSPLQTYGWNEEGHTYNNFCTNPEPSHSYHQYPDWGSQHSYSWSYNQEDDYSTWSSNSMNTYMQPPPSPPPQEKKPSMKELIKNYIAEHGYEIFVRKDEEEVCGNQELEKEFGHEVEENLKDDIENHEVAQEKQNETPKEDELEECKFTMEVPTDPFYLDFVQDLGIGNFHFFKMGLGASKKRKRAWDPKSNIDDLDPTNMKTVKRLFMEYFLYHPP